MRWQIAVAALAAAAAGFAVSKALVLVPQPSAKSDLVFTSVKELMESIIDPSADTLWNAVGTVVDQEKGIQELTPKTPEEWLDVRRAAVRIVEGSNLLMMQGREAAPPGTKSDTPGVELEPAEIAELIKKDRGSFDGFAKQLQALGVEAVQAIDRKNPDQLMDIGERLDGVCEACHQTFWYPNASAPQPAGR